MADDPQKTPPAEGSEEAAEKHFWDEHEKRTMSVLDKWLETKKTELSQSRGGGRTTIPKIFADIVFGPEKK